MGIEQELNYNKMRTIGYILLIIGAVASVIFGIQVLNQSEGFEFLGIKVGVSSANWAPLIVSLVVLVVGIVLLTSRRKSLS